MISINYTSHYFKQYKCRLFWFYPDGKWDQLKRTYVEAINEYPKDKFNWIKIDET